MAAKRGLLLIVVLILVAGLLVGCGSPQSEDATFIGYKQRPSDNTAGVAIVQLTSGQPAEASTTYTTLENGAPLKVVKEGTSYKVLSVSPDWTSPGQ